MRRNILSSVISAAIATAFLSRPSPGFMPSIHYEMTESTLALIEAEADGEIVRFSPDALEQIAWGNYLTDVSPGFFVGRYHFTEEEFRDSSTRLVRLRDQIISLVAPSDSGIVDGFRARILMGSALHTLQDFYAHSNWIELGNTEPHYDLGRYVLANPPASATSCFEDEPAVLVPGGGQLTSAYYFNPLGCSAPPPLGKCWHGGPLGCEGIHKDRPDRPGHFAARQRAIEATQDYIGLILDGLEGNDHAIRTLLDVRGTIGFVIDDTGSMSEEIDGVKTLASLIVNFLDAVPVLRPENWLLVRFGEGVGAPFITNEAITMLLALQLITPSGGGDCPERSQGGALAAIEAARPDSRLYIFTDASAKDRRRRSTVMRRAKDKRITLTWCVLGSCSPIDESYIQTAEETGGQLFWLHYSEIVDLFDLIVPELGGDLQTISRIKGTLGNSTLGLGESILLPSSSNAPEEVPIAWPQQAAAAAAAVGASHTIEFPVDTSMTRLLVSVTLARADGIVLRDPSGTVLDPTDPNVNITEISSGWIVLVDSPTPGNWELEIAGAGAFSTAIRGNSALELYSFDFVETVEGVHPGLYKIDGEPIAGTSLLGQAVMLGPYASVTFGMVDPSGNALGDLALAQGYPNAAPRHFAGEMIVPEEAFRVVATGTDASGSPFRRQLPGSFVPQMLGVSVVPPADASIPAGTTRTMVFTVQNLGAAGVFTIDATTDLGALTRVQPSTLNLLSNGAGVVEVDLTVPPVATDQSPVTVSLTAAAAENPDVFNGASMTLVVEGIVADCNGDGSDDQLETAPEFDPRAFDAVTSDAAEDAMHVCPTADAAYAGNNFEATSDSIVTCGNWFGVYDVWYRYRPRWNGTAFVGLQGPPTQWILAIYDSLPAAGDTPIACNGLNPNGVNFAAQKGHEYFIRIAAAGHTKSDVEFSMTLVGPACLANPIDANGNRIPDECECLADISGVSGAPDGMVDTHDFLAMVLTYGPCVDPCPADIDGNGVVDDEDLRMLLVAMGPCPEAE